MRGGVKQILKITLIAVMAWLLVAACRQGSESNPAASPPVSPPVTNENVVETFSRIEEDWVEANVKADAAFQDSNLADDDIGTTEDGSTVKQDSVD